MNEPRNDPEDLALRNLLQRWQVEATAPPRFAEGVWRRVGRMAEPVPTRNGWWRWVTAVAELAVRPRFAAGYLAALLVLGAGMGALRGQAESRGAAGDLKGRYVQSVDPFFDHAR